MQIGISIEVQVTSRFVKWHWTRTEDIKKSSSRKQMRKQCTRFTNSYGSYDEQFTIQVRFYISELPQGIAIPVHILSNNGRLDLKTIVDVKIRFIGLHDTPLLVSISWGDI